MFVTLVNSGDELLLTGSGAASRHWRSLPVRRPAASSQKPSQRRMIVPVVSLVLGVLLLAVTAWVTLRDAGTARPGGLGAVGGPFELTSQEGTPISDKDLRGRPFLIFFGFTNCPDVCPTALREISDVFAALGPDRRFLHFS